MYHDLSIHLLKDILVCFHVLTFMNRVAINMHMQVFVWTYVFSAFGSLPRSTITEAYGKRVFSPVKNCQPVFQSGSTVLNPPQQ